MPTRSTLYHPLEVNVQLIPRVASALTRTSFLGGSLNSKANVRNQTSDSALFDQQFIPCLASTAKNPNEVLLVIAKNVVRNISDVPIIIAYLLPLIEIVPCLLC